MRMFLLLAAMFMATMTVAQETGYNTNWSGHRTLAVNTTASGANVAGGVANFPILVRLSTADSAVFAAAKVTGADIRFTKADNTTRLPHEIESWDSAGRSAAIWVKLDTVLGNANTLLRMHWGNAAAADSSKGSSVFSAANGYLAVWHMNSPINNAGDTLFDATGNGRHGIAGLQGSGGGVTLPADTAGIIGKGKRFTGTAATSALSTGGFFTITNADSALNLNTNTGPYTISAWTAPAVCHTTARVAVFSKYVNGDSPANGRSFALHTGNSTGAPWRISNVPSAFQGASGTTSEYIASATCTANEWTYLSASYNSNGAAPTADLAGAANVRLFKNDTLSGIANTTGTVNQVSVGTAATVYIGRLQSTDRFMRGGIDEIRVSNVQRSANWNKLEYENQKPGSAVVTEVTAPTNLRYLPGTTAADTIVFQTGVAYNIVPTYTGGPVDSIKITSATTTLPAGISLNIFTGVLSGTPTATFAAANRTFTAYSTLGNTTRTVRISAVLGPTMNLAYAPDTATYPVGLAVVNGPTWSGRAPTKFTVTPALPAGLAIDSVTGVISGTPTAQVAAANYTVRATNTTGPDTATKVIRLTIGAPEDFNTWAQHQTVWLNTQANGAGVNKLIRQFPVLVRLDSANFNAGFAQAASGGADIRFSKADNATRLAHQIDHWDSAGKRAAIWVLVDSIPGNIVKSIRMHWGKAGAPNTSSGPAVFRTQDGFRAVWHMNGPTDTSNEPDATANGLTANQASAPPVVNGVIGRGRNFVNPTTTATDYFRVTGSAAPLNMTAGGNYSISAWANLTTTTTHATLVSKHDLSYALKLDANAAWEFFEFNGGWNAVSGPATPGTWQHIVGVQNGFDAAMYINGVRVDFGITNTSSGSARNEGVDLMLGAEPTSNTAQRRPLDGMADEIRIAAVSRDTAWAKLEYENQRPTGQTLVSFTQPVSIGGSVAARVETFGITAKPQGEGVLFQVQGAGDSKRTRITLVDMFGRTVWSRTLAASAGTQEVLWNGQAQNGARASAGVYVVRAALLDAAGKPVQTLERKLPLTR
jgi:hypothetical protein